MPNIQYDLIKAKDKIEESNLRSALIFNYKKRNRSRTDSFDKVIFAIILDSKGSCTVEHIKGTYSSRFQISIDDDVLSSSINRLAKLGLISRKDDYLVPKDSTEADEFYDDLQNRTDRLINSIISKAQHMLGPLLFDIDENRAKKNIGQALSVYFHMYGFTYFGTQSDADIDTEDAISIVTSGFDAKISLALVRAIADTLHSPSSDELETLTIWAQAFISSQIMGLDPVLRNFKATKLSGKTFVIDTDVALNCITKNAKYSSDYKNLVNKLLQCGCRLIVPEEVILEVKDHADAANKRYSIVGDAIKSYTYDMLEGKGSNVFIEDYVKTVRLNPALSKMSFDDYIGNIYCKDDDEVILSSLSAIFSKNILNANLPAKVDVEELTTLANKINEKTIETEKASNRTPEENMDISRTDALLYLSIKNINKSIIDSGILAFDYYLLTRTTRTIKCANEVGLYDKNIICNPNVLFSILQEIGVVEEKRLSIINLFDNPFLAYSAKMLWDDIKPLLDSGANFCFRDLNRLRHDFKIELNRLMTDEDPESVAEYAIKVTEDGYSFASQLAYSANKISDLEQGLQKAQEAIAAKDEEINKKDKTIKKLIEEKNALRAKTKKGAGQNSNRTKKRGKKR